MSTNNTVHSAQINDNRWVMWTATPHVCRYCFISGPCMCHSGEMPDFQHIMYSSRVGILPGERECHWVYHKNHLVPFLANGFLFWEKGKKAHGQILKGSHSPARWQLEDETESVFRPNTLFLSFFGQEIKISELRLFRWISLISK